VRATNASKLSRSYFHVWSDDRVGGASALGREGRKLAESLSYTKAFVEEPFQDFRELVYADEPKIVLPSEGDEAVDEPAAWISHQKEIDGRWAFGVGHTYSMWRKVYKALQLVKGSGIAYSLVIRARPDHIFLQPMDLRAFGREFAAKPSVVEARGHFLSIAERSGQSVTDQFAVGSMDAVLAYGDKVWPFESSCCEGFVEKTLHYHCFVRNEKVLSEEFTDVEAVRRVYREPTPERGDYEREWRVIPDALRRSEYSPRLLNQPVTRHVGLKGCENGGCIPLYRTRYLYIHRVVTDTWLQHGAICVGMMGDGYLSGPFLVESGVASHVDDETGKIGFKPCIVVPSLESSLKATRAYIDAMPAAIAREIYETRA
jgi:hypothetical protein